MVCSYRTRSAMLLLLNIRILIHITCREGIVLFFLSNQIKKLIGAKREGMLYVW